MDLEYLAQVSDAMSRSLSCISLARGAEPRVTQLASLLLKEADALAEQRRAATAAGTAAAASAAQQAARTAATACAVVAAAARSAEAVSHAKILAASISALDSAEDVTPVLLTRLLDSLREVTGATGAYIAERLPLGDDGEPAHIRYVAAGTGDEDLLSEVLPRGRGVTWRVWERVEAAAAATTAEQAELEPNHSVTHPLPPLYIPSLLQDASAVYYKIPSAGAFLAVPVVYRCALHAGAAPPQARDAGDGDASEDAARDGAATSAAPPPVHLTRRLAICLDRLVPAQHAGAEFTAAHIEAVSRAGAALAASLERTELSLYAADVAADAAQHAASAAPEREAEESEPASIGAAAEEALPSDAADDTRALRRAEAEAAAARRLLLAPPRRAMLAALGARRIQPPAAVVAAMVAALRFVGVPARALTSPTALDPTAPDWDAVRAHVPRLLDDLAQGRDVAAPRPPATVPPCYPRAETTRAALTALDLSDAGTAPRVLARFILASLDACDAAARQAQRQEEEAAARRAAEAEAAALAAAEAAEAARAAEEAAADAAAAALEEGEAADASG